MIKLGDLSIDEKIGQRFIFGTNSDNIDCLIELIKNSFIGGVILYKRNYTTYDEMLKVVKKLKEANKDNKVPLFIAIDQEGGKVNRMPEEIHRLKNVYDVSKTDKKLIKDHAEIISKMLYETGINMNFAPVLDIYNGSKSRAIYKRCFYGDYKNVMEAGEKYINVFTDNKVIPVIKHFPGHGASKVDSHRTVPHIFASKGVLNVHMKPFEVAIENGAPAVMVGHLSVGNLTNGLPASISESFIQKYLVKKNNYKGLVLTDEINMLKRSLRYRFVFLDKALRTSNDIILIKIKTSNEGYKVINKYKKIVNKSDLDMSVEKILDLKEKYEISDQIDFSGCDIEEINSMIDKINDKVKNS